MATYTQLVDGNDDGTKIGISSADKLGFFGVVPVVQPSGSGQAAYTAIGQHALTDNGGGTADQTVASQAAPTSITDSTGLSGSHNDTLAAVSGQKAGYVYYQNITAATTTGGADQKDVSGGGGAMANIVQPDVPRNIILNFTDGDALISAFQVDVVGVATDGSATAEQFLFAGGLDQTGSVIHAKITSVTVTSITGNGAGDVLDIGYGVKLGVPLPAGSTGLGIVKLVSNGTEEAASATDTANNSFTATTAPNATNDYEVWYEYIDAQETILNQNCSDLAQKIIELVTLAGVAQANLKEVTTELALIKIDIANTRLLGTAGRTALVDLGLIAGA